MPGRLSCRASSDLPQKSVDFEGGLQLLPMAPAQLALFDHPADCFENGRKPELVVHDLTALLR